MPYSLPVYQSDVLGRHIGSLPAYSAPLFCANAASDRAADLTIWAMRNTSATKSCIITHLHAALTAAVAAGRGARGGMVFARFSTATPTGGTALAAVPNATGQAASAVTDVRYAEAGLTVTSVVFEGPFSSLGVGAGLDATASVDVIDPSFPITLAPGQGLCVRSYGGGYLTGCGLDGTVSWYEV